MESNRLIGGDEFILGAPEKVPAVWGDNGSGILWAQGEPLIITGPPGVGKTTLGAQVVLGRIGHLPDLLGLPIREGTGRVLYLACDRPAQIGRALRRTFGHLPATVLADRLTFLAGPPSQDLARHPGWLLSMAQEVGADTVVIDSIKDVAVKLSDEETGQGLNRAFQMCVSNGVEVLAYHHQTKHGGDGKGKPTSLENVYGSAWITAGAGSVVLLWGRAGDSQVELTHLKQPAEKVGPLQVTHDHGAGRSSLAPDIDLMDWIRFNHDGVTAREAAHYMTGSARLERNDVQRARRALDAMVKDGLLTKEGATTKGGSGGGGEGTRYAAVRRVPSGARSGARASGGER